MLNKLTVKLCFTLQVCQCRVGTCSHRHIVDTCDKGMMAHMAGEGSLEVELLVKGVLTDTDRVNGLWSCSSLHGVQERIGHKKT